MFKGSWQEIEDKESRYLKELRQMATVASMGSSTRIEGVKISDAEIEKLLMPVKTIHLRNEMSKKLWGSIKP